MSVPTFGSNQLSLQEIYGRQAEALNRATRQAWELSLAHCRDTLAKNRRDPDAYIATARCHKKLGEHETAMAVLQEGRKSCSPTLHLYQCIVRLLEECNRTQEAISAAHEAAVSFPDDVSMKLKEALLLPILYDTPDEVDHYRLRFEEGLQKVRREIPLDTPDAMKRAVSAIGTHSNVFLGYQGRNDRDLQVQYGELIHRIMAASYPDCVESVPMPETPDNGALRVGYISSRFRNLSATKYFLGWLREHAPERIVTYAYSVGRKTDAVTGEVRRSSRHFRQLSDHLEDAYETIRKDRLHVLVYWDIGMDPAMTRLAALRLAPVQCVAWDQPITSGLPTIDYFLSSSLAEPADAPEHYSEELILLPGVGVCYQKPVIPTALLRQTRRDFGIQEDAVVYLCCQYIFKYLPEQDAIFARIAARVRNAQFVFLAENEVVASDLRRRLDRAFSGVGLSAEQHCLLLPAVDRFTYWNLYLLGDAFLDTIGWSGGVSTFEAVACRLPVVTLPGRYMRGRQSYAILTQLGATETIARDEQEYVETAVRLGLNRAWRDQVIQGMTSGWAALYSDKRCVTALEEFLLRAVDKRRRAQSSNLPRCES
jgi:protein O-GlcNAc transferase